MPKNDKITEALDDIDIEDADHTEAERELTPKDYSTFKLIKAHAKLSGLSTLEALEDMLTRGLIDGARVGVVLLIFVAGISAPITTVLSLLASIVLISKARKKLEPKRDDIIHELEQLSKLRRRLKIVPKKTGAQPVMAAPAALPT